MNAENERGSDDRVVVGYFADGGNALRAINELIDEGFDKSEIGAAFRSRPSGLDRMQSNAEVGGIQELAERNPASSGSVGGAASHDEAVQPAGLAPGSGNAFPAPVGPGPIPGSETPSELPHQLRRDLPTDEEIAARKVQSSGPQREAQAQRQEDWRETVGRKFADSPQRDAKPRGDSNLKFGTGEGHLFAENEYSAPEFQNSFTGMGLSSTDARGFSGSLGRGGAVVSVSPANRASLAEAILERNHGRIRFEESMESGEAAGDSQVRVYGRLRSYYRGDGDWQRRKAS